ncbi:flagellar biosynthesis anti-sigma factor FlgM [Acerihabitans arboris]|uniref:Negative regulator of flagellin synthesis n=1 Tax=Acerihabitans arboris TaxID=2691583 RepID=A0A845SN11_9GAMM|nr:flagellar biosynthesis anti-sigma factor FlgM [Acerihabitans arboris]NDL62625.1 anti-sigma-28 factor FlgM [Acerihabitans arboris]
MSIDTTRPIPGLSPIQNSELSNAQPQKSSAAGASGDSQETQVNLSDAQARLRQPNSQDFNSAKVESLKQAIRNGELKVDTGKIADELIAQTQSMLDE